MLTRLVYTHLKLITFPVPYGSANFRLAKNIGYVEISVRECYRVSSVNPQFEKATEEVSIIVTTESP